MSNLFKIFKDLIPTEPLLVGTVLSSVGDVHRVQLPGNDIRIVRGKTSNTGRVFVKGDVIQGEAPNLGTVLEIQV